MGLSTGVGGWYHCRARRLASHAAPRPTEVGGAEEHLRTGSNMSNIAGPNGTKEIVEVAKHYLDKILAAPLQEFSGLLADKVNYWRFKNRINTILKAKAFLESKGIDPKAALPGSIVPLIEAAGDTDDDTLQSMFATLLASHLNPETLDKVHPCYTRILSQLAPFDAQLMNFLYQSIRKKGQGPREIGASLETACKTFDVSADTALLSFQNLWRLGLCDRGGGLEHLNQAKQILFTEFGWSFMVACVADVTAYPPGEARQPRGERQDDDRGAVGRNPQ